MTASSRFFGQYKRHINTKNLQTRLVQRKSISQKNRDEEVRKTRGLPLGDVNVSFEQELNIVEEGKESCEKGQENKPAASERMSRQEQRRAMLQRYKETKQLLKLKEREKSSKGPFRCGIYKPKVSLISVFPSRTAEKEKPPAPRVTRSVLKVDPPANKTRSQVISPPVNDSNEREPLPVPDPHVESETFAPQYFVFGPLDGLSTSMTLNRANAFLTPAFTWSPLGMNRAFVVTPENTEQSQAATEVSLNASPQDAGLRVNRLPQSNALKSATKNGQNFVTPVPDSIENAANIEPERSPNPVRSPVKALFGVPEEERLQNQEAAPVSQPPQHTETEPVLAEVDLSIYLTHALGLGAEESPGLLQCLGLASETQGECATDIETSIEADDVFLCSPEKRDL